MRLWISVIALFAICVFGLTGCGGGGAGGKLDVAGTAPASPSDPAAVGGMNQNILSWSAVSGATSYNIYWSTSPGVTKTSGVKIPGVTSPYNHLGLSTGSTYYYIVTAVNSAGESEPSAEVSAKTISPSLAPAAVRATPEGGRVTLTWAPVTGATSYNIYYLPNEPRLTPGNGIKLASVGNPYIHSGLINGTTYYYAVTAVVDGIESAPAPVVSAIPSLNPAPAAPYNLKAISYNNPLNGTQGISITWDGPPDTTSYNAYYSDSPGVTTRTGIKVPGVTSTYRPDLPVGNYYFILTALGANGESTTSPEMTIFAPVFTRELVSGKNIRYSEYNDSGTATGGVFTFTCRPDGTLTFTSNLTGVPASGTGTWSADGTLTVTIAGPSLELGFEVMSISNNGATIGVNFTKGSEGELLGSMTVM